MLGIISGIILKLGQVLSNKYELKSGAEMAKRQF